MLDNTQSESRLPKNEPFDFIKNKRVVDRLVLSRVWILAPEYKSRCDVYFLRCTTVSQLLSILDIEDSYIDFLKIGNNKYSLAFVNASTSYLQELEDTGKGELPILLSFRICKKLKLSVCLGLLNPYKVYKNVSNLVNEEGIKQDV